MYVAVDDDKVKAELHIDLVLASTHRLVRPPRLLGFGGRPYSFFDREAIPTNLSTVLVCVCMYMYIYHPHPS